VETNVNTPPEELPRFLDQLEGLYGKPRRPLPKRALDWILWENAAYLVPDARRKKAFAALRARTKLRAAGILSLPRADLLEIAALGGMLAELRVSKLIAIAETIQEQFDGNLETALKLPLPKARSALRKFPGIGAPGADKILLFTGAVALPALESNGLRALVRLGHAEEGRSYSTTYRSGIAALSPHVDRGGPWLMRAYDLLRVHGQTLCKNNGPLCDECPLDDECTAVV
jgi:endonuclease III